MKVAPRMSAIALLVASGCSSPPPLTTENAARALETDLANQAAALDANVSAEANRAAAAAMAEANAQAAAWGNTAGAAVINSQ